MKATQKLHELGQSLWLDNITRDLLERGTLQRYIDELSVTGLTSNPTIFEHAIRNSTSYDATIRRKREEGRSGEQLFFDLALEDLTRAADLFRPIHERTNGVDGWVSLEVTTHRKRSPRLRASMRWRAARTCSSRSRGPRKACPRSRRPSSRVSRSM
jgi:transaldolase